VEVDIGPDVKLIQALLWLDDMLSRVEKRQITEAAMAETNLQSFNSVGAVMTELNSSDAGDAPVPVDPQDERVARAWAEPEQ
jgi:hypothetical protein